MATPIVYVICDQNCKFESMTKEQIISAIAEATGNTITNVDDAFITMIKEQNAGESIRFWVGTQAEYNAIVANGAIDPNTIYCTTDGSLLTALSAQVATLEETVEAHERWISTEAVGRLPIERGGTGAATATDARKNLGLGKAATYDTLPIANGGTGATSASSARSKLGLGSLATKNTAPIENGGTGATTAEDGRRNLGIDFQQVSLGLKTSGVAGVYTASKAITFPVPSSMTTGYCTAFATVSGADYNGITCKVEVTNGNTGAVTVYAHLLNSDSSAGTIYCTINVLAVWSEVSGEVG